MSPAGGAPLDRFLAEAVERGVTPGAVALVAAGDRVIARAARGDAQIVPGRDPMAQDTPFDLASLTKPLVTAFLAAALAKDLGLRPETRARSLLPELDTLDHADITLRHLLGHASGLPAWRPLFVGADDVRGYLRALRRERLTGLPGRQVLYSDPGYIAAGEMIARAAGAGLDALFRERIAVPLGLTASFNPSRSWAARAAATEVGQRCERDMAGDDARGYQGWREGVIRGQVHDHHAFVSGGVLGSAGLFGTADDVHRLALECLGDGRGLLSGAARERLQRPVTGPAGEARSEGFAVNAAADGSGGPALPPSAFGHTGFTGTSVWIDPVRRRIYVLLTNRIHPEVRPVDMLRLRREFHRVAAEA